VPGATRPKTWRSALWHRTTSLTYPALSLPWWWPGLGFSARRKALWSLICSLTGTPCDREREDRV
jgi:hypothetical protein